MRNLLIAAFMLLALGACARAEFTGEDSVFMNALPSVTPLEMDDDNVQPLVEEGDDVAVSDLDAFLNAPLPNHVKGVSIVDLNSFRQELEKVKSNLVARKNNLLEREKEFGEDLRMIQGRIAEQKRVIAIINKMAEQKKKGDISSLEGKAKEDLYRLKPELRDLDDGLKFTAELRVMISKLGKLDPNSPEYVKIMQGVRQQLSHPAWKQLTDLDTVAAIAEIDKGCEKLRTGKISVSESDKELESKYLRDEKEEKAADKKANKEIKKIEKEAKKGQSDSPAKVIAAIQREEIAGLVAVLNRMEKSIQTKRASILATLKGDNAALLHAKALGIKPEDLPKHQKMLAEAEKALSNWKSEFGSKHEEILKSIAAYNTEISRIEAMERRVMVFGMHSNFNGTVAATCPKIEQTKPSMLGFKDLSKGAVASAVVFRVDDEIQTVQSLCGSEETRSKGTAVKGSDIPVNFFEFLDVATLDEMHIPLAVEPVVADESDPDLAKWEWIQEDIEVDDPAPHMMSWNEFQTHYAKMVGTGKTTAAERADAYRKYKAEWAQNSALPPPPAAPVDQVEPVPEVAAAPATKQPAVKKEAKIDVNTFISDGKFSVELSDSSVSFTNARSQSFSQSFGSSDSEFEVPTGVPGISLAFSKEKSGFTASVIKTTTSSASKDGKVAIGQDGRPTTQNTASKASVLVKGGKLDFNLQRSGSDLGVSIKTSQGGSYAVKGKVDHVDLTVEVAKGGNRYAFDLGFPGDINHSLEKGKTAFSGAVQAQEINFGLSKNIVSIGCSSVGAGAQMQLESDNKISVSMSRISGSSEDSLEYEYGGRIVFDSKQSEAHLGGALNGEAQIKIRSTDANSESRIDIGLGAGKNNLALRTTLNAVVGVDVAGIKMAQVNVETKGNPETRWSIDKGQLRYQLGNGADVVTTYLGRQIQTSKVSQNGRIQASLDLAGGKISVATQGDVEFQQRINKEKTITLKSAGKTVVTADTEGDVSINGDAGSKIAVIGADEKGAQTNAAGIQSSFESNKLETTVTKDHTGKISIKKGKVDITSTQCSGNCEAAFNNTVKEEVATAPTKGFAERMLQPADSVQKYLMENGVKGMAAIVNGKEVSEPYGFQSVEDKTVAKSTSKNVEKDLKKLKEKFVGAMQSLKTKVVSSKAFISAKKVYTQSKERLKGGIKTIKSKLGLAAAELKKRIRDSPVYQSAQKLGKQLKTQFTEAKTKLTRELGKGTPEYNKAITELKSSIKESDLFKRGKKLAGAVRDAWTKGKDRLVTAFNKSKTKIRTVITKSKAFKAAIAFGTKTKEFVKVTTSKLRKAYNTARKSLSEKLAKINFGGKASQDKKLSKSADSILKNFSNTVKDFKKAAGTMNTAGKKLFNSKAKKEEKEEVKDVKKADKAADKKFEKTAHKDIKKAEKKVGLVGRLLQATKKMVDKAVTKASVGLSKIVGKNSAIAKKHFEKAVKMVKKASKALKGKFSAAKKSINSTTSKIRYGLAKLKANSAKLSKIFSKSSKSSKSTKLSNEVAKVAKKIGGSIKKHASSVTSNLAKLTSRLRQISQKVGSRVSKSISDIKEGIYKTGIRNRATTRKAGRRVADAVKKATKETKKTLRKIGNKFSEAAKKTTHAIHNSFKELDSALTGLKSKMSRKTLRKDIRRTSRRDRRTEKATANQLRRKWSRDSFRRLGKSERGFKKGIDRSIRNMEKSKRSNRDFRSMRETIRRKFDKLGDSSRTNRLQRLMRRQFSKGSTLRAGMRSIRRENERRRESSRQRKMLGRFEKRFRRGVDSRRSERKGFERLSKKFSRESRAVRKGDRRTVKSLERKFRRDSRSRRERRELSSVRKTLRSDSRRSRNAKRYSRFEKSIDRGFRRQQRGARRSDRRTRSEISSYGRKEREGDRVRRLRRTISRDGRRLSSTERRDTRNVDRTVRRSQSGDGEKFRKLSRKLRRESDEVKADSRRSVERVRRSGRDTERDTERVSQETLRRERRQGDEMRRDVRRSGDKIKSKLNKTERGSSRGTSSTLDAADRRTLRAAGRIQGDRAYEDEVIKRQNAREEYEKNKKNGHHDEDEESEAATAAVVQKAAKKAAESANKIISKEFTEVNKQVKEAEKQTREAYSDPEAVKTLGGKAKWNQFQHEYAQQHDGHTTVQERAAAYHARG